MATISEVILMNDRITSPADLNRRLKVSEWSVWIILLLLLSVMAAWLWWFFRSEIVVTEKCTCLVCGDERTSGEYIYDLVLQDSGDPELAAFCVADTEEDYGTAAIRRHVQTVCLFVGESVRGRITGAMKVRVSGHEGIVVRVPSDSFDYRLFLERAGWGKNGVPEVTGVPSNDRKIVMAGLYIDPGTIPLEPGVYPAEIILEVIRPSALISR